MYKNNSGVGQLIVQMVNTFLFGCCDRGAFWLTVKLRLLSFLRTSLLSHSLTCVLLSCACKSLTEMPIRSFGCYAICKDFVTDALQSTVHCQPWSGRCRAVFFLLHRVKQETLSLI